MFNLQGKKVLVVGMARSGQAAAHFLVKQGALVTGTDQKSEDVLGSGFKELKKLPISLVTGGYPEIRPDDFDLVIVSPGVPRDIEPISAAEYFNIPIWSELELAGRFIKEPIISVTGTNGKTTTTSLLGYIFEQAGLEVVVAGNIGVPLIQEVEKSIEEPRRRTDYWVVEVSSFQLERIECFRPHIAVFLNLAPDHLDRHGDLGTYGRTKARVFANQGSDDYAVYNLDDLLVSRYMNSVLGEKCGFSCYKLPHRGIGVQGEHIIYTFQGKDEPLCSVRDIRMPGFHNLENALAAAAVSLLAGVDQDCVVKALTSFPGVPHRVEEVRVLDGVRYVNDSKGTNPEAVLKALDSYEAPVILIAGGRYKGGNLDELTQKICKKAKALILLGEAAPLFRKAAMAVGFNEIWEVSSLSEAVELAHNIARTGDVVLLSPGCASWDMFRDYEERGDLFRKVVEEL
ncbi:MAG TPA: UDP-N-acetylmuramoyl-L-alanine--D-glutamate ligase [Syntrophomonadaceae bacterium]|nr:UDP-N-acetylmuramoyl-L-alanine--D-glutamate ligase [Syntrophomonadaceae bacterium]